MVWSQYGILVLILYPAYMELTKEYFDKHYQELNEFLSEQFEKVFARFETIDNRFEAVATKADLLALDKRITDGFAEVGIKLDFIQADIATLRKDLEALVKRTKEDNNAFTKEILKLKSRLDTLEKQVQVLKRQRA